MKFSIVTPTYNSEKYLEETILSVLSQKGNFDIQYIVADGASTDKTVEIVKKYQDLLKSGNYKPSCSSLSLELISEKDSGMYDALNKGFARAQGDVCAWINADDLYEPDAFAAVSKALQEFPETRWIKGVTTNIDETGAIVAPGRCYLYRQDWIRKGIYGQESYFIGQDSMFWRASLWKECGPFPTELRYAGDYWLWARFAEIAAPLLVDVPLSRFRKRQGQLSKNIDAYKAEQFAIRPERSFSAWAARLFFAPQSRLVYRFPSLERLFIELYRIFFNPEKSVYVDMSKDEPEIKRAYSYIATPPVSKGS